MNISTNKSVQTDNSRKISKLPKPFIRLKKRKGRLAWASTGAVYLSITVLLVTFLSVSYRAPLQAEQLNRGQASEAVIAEVPTADQLKAANLSAAIAEYSELAVAPKVANVAISLNVKRKLSQTRNNILTKPHIVEADQAGVIRTYTTRGGDTVDRLAQRFAVSEQTIKWSNDLTSDALEAGIKLYIPTINGFVYTAKSGDTAGKLASKFQSSKQQIITYNSLERKDLKKGMKLVIPNGVLPANMRPQDEQQSIPEVASTTSVYRNAAQVGNRYAYGYCTWYAYNRRVELGLSVGSFWGNATTWDDFARGSGYGVSGTPSAGAILVINGIYGGYGHVAIVESVNPDGSISVSGMNWAGWGVVSHRNVSAAQAAGYIYIR